MTVAVVAAVVGGTTILLLLPCIVDGVAAAAVAAVNIAMPHLLLQLLDEAALCLSIQLALFYYSARTNCKLQMVGWFGCG